MVKYCPGPVYVDKSSTILEHHIEMFFLMITKLVSKPHVGGIGELFPEIKLHIMYIFKVRGGSRDNDSAS